MTLPWRTATGWSAASARTSTAVAVFGHPGGTDEDRVHRAAFQIGEFQVSFEGAHLTPEGVALGADVEDAEMVAVEHDQPGTGPEHGRPGPGQLADRVAEALPLDPERHYGRLSARNDQRVEPLELGRHADLAALAPSLTQELGVGLEVALQREHAHHRLSDAGAVGGPAPAGSRTATSRGGPAAAQTRAWKSRG